MLNPVRAKGMVGHIEEWPWSSYLAFIGKTKAYEWLTTDWILSQFSNDTRQAKDNFLCFVLEGVNRKIDIWSGLKGQIFLDDESFVSKMQNKFEKKQMIGIFQKNKNTP